ncbi:alpha-N-acetylglucosaminidase-like [Haliotis rufescens]|uniref:alpha-N-acetylglucosaminidase-like n=1 Tax=Haliotis rufescens TaxID=6454 RepID=UPI00201F9838|nr:alpha-N-acetylglucosaminidase-like [Haliotis rufescens]
MARDMASLKTLVLALSMVQLTGAIEFSTLDHLRSRTPADVQARAATELIMRVVGDRRSDFDIKVDPSSGPADRDTFTLEQSGSKLSITGTSGVAVAMGFYYYLKYYCGGQFTWAGQQVALPTVLPKVSMVTVTSNDRFRYYQNVCTVSYSFAWSDWDQWERHIDWMALQGINLPLAFTGQEAIFQRVYLSMGFTIQDMEAHFGGPAFLAWARMGNIRGWGGPLPEYWMDRQLALQHKILDRMRSLGIIPVLPGFAGHVPAAITRVFPKANVTRLGSWANFNANYSETYLLDFNDPLFTTIGSKFIKAMEDEFGIDHIYNADSFNEMTPASSDPAYLASAARGVYNAMVAGDSQAIWLMQGWLFVNGNFWKDPQIKALLTAVPRGKMIILDLYSEQSPIFSRTESYYGQPFIWCMLHNFGGLNEMYGELDKVNEGPFKGRNFPNSSMVGTGLTPEGINQNEIMYEFMNEQAWRPGPVNTTEWIDQYQAQRYGGGNPSTSAAWDYLRQSVYKSGSTGVTIIHRPSIGSHESVGYDPEMLYQAWDKMVAAQFTTTALRGQPLFVYDLIDVSRNSLQVLAIKYYADVIAAYNKSDTASLRTAGAKMIDLLSDLDTLLATDVHFLLGAWTGDAARHFSSAWEKALYDFNSRNQVTLWGPTGQIMDYACKMWSGLINRYYKPRWQLFINTLINCTQTKTAFNSGVYGQEVLNTVEIPFSYDQTDFPNEPEGNAIAAVIEFHSKYRPETKSKFFSQFPNVQSSDTVGGFSYEYAKRFGRAHY